MNVIQRATNGIHALKLIRPSTDPSINIGVIPANTNWKYTSEAWGNLKSGPVVISGIVALFCSAAWPRTLPGLPMKLPKNPVFESDNPWKGEPKPILKAHNTHTMRTTAKAAKVSIMLLMDQRFCITPPYSTTRPGTLIRPTSVAAVSCHALSPGLSQVG